MMAFELDGALPLALGAARGDAHYPIVDPARRTQAIQIVGRFGTEKDAAALESLLNDTTEFLPQPPVNPAQPSAYSVQIRDVALATMLHLTQQDPKDYGFMRARRHPQTVFDASSLGFESDERRAAAAAKGREWKVAIPLDEVPPR